MFSRMTLRSELSNVYQPLWTYIPRNFNHGRQKRKILGFNFLTMVFLDIQYFWDVTLHFWARLSRRFEDPFDVPR